jgi:hypothetical protein
MKDVSLIIRGDSRGAESALSAVQRGAAQMHKNWLGITASMAASWVTVNKAIDLASQGAAFQAQGTGFANLAASYGKSADQIIADLQRVSNGTLSIQQTIEQAGKAMVLGVGAD